MLTTALQPQCGSLEQLTEAHRRGVSRAPAYELVVSLPDSAQVIGEPVPAEIDDGRTRFSDGRAQSI